MKRWKVLSATMVGQQEKFLNSRRPIMAKTVKFWLLWQPFNNVWLWKSFFFFLCFPFFVLLPQKVEEEGEGGGGVLLAPPPPTPLVLLVLKCTVKHLCDMFQVMSIGCICQTHNFFSSSSGKTGKVTKSKWVFKQSNIFKEYERQIKKIIINVNTVQQTHVVYMQ